MSAQEARKYAMTRIGKGDYLLLANDGKTLWRLSTYHEDGSAVRGDGKRITGTFWGTWVYRKPVTDATRIVAHDWSDFDMDDCLLRSRREAIACALATAKRWEVAS